MYKVLIVEDEALIRKGLIYSINWADFDCNVVSEAENGLEGIEKIKEHHPDIVLVDINMPILNGFEMIKQTSEEFNYSAIVVSGYNEFDYAKQAIRFGVSEYLLKPVDHQELKNALIRAIEQIEMRKSYLYQISKKDEITESNVLDDSLLILSDKSVVVAQMIEYIQQNYPNKIIMYDLVEKLQCSATLLNNKFKSETGTTFNDYLNRYRILVAVKLIKEKKQPIYRIAELTGFKNYKYFNIVFNKYIGCSPKEFAKATC
ncbi:response regulator transcription factor [Anaerorhabdus furcosa]|uniref:Two-component system, response regulator YesN n=1 Tax=Anaerorhabdus furcosa TaxID=118967 RepID=A0A1T4JY07_9FIRM|nr:response regulator [Anaerorhabdus furcosa]SJZ35096.1 two-component system, response regulator YesN [Anaerorhabdus furcosa]